MNTAVGWNQLENKRNRMSRSSGLRQFFEWRCCGYDCPQRDKWWPAWLRNRAGVHFEGKWYCAISCLESVLDAQVRNLFAGTAPEKPKAHRHPIGSILVRRGVLSRENLNKAITLQQQKAGSRRLGEWLQEMHLISAEQLVAALGQQWGCPVFPLEKLLERCSYIDVLPVHLLASAQAVPAHVSQDGATLHLAFANRLDHTMLYAVEVMLGCRTLACVATDSSVAAMLDNLRRASAGNETCFETIRDPREITRTICSYAGEVRASRISMARVAGYLWIRFHKSSSSRDLLFRLCLAPSPASTNSIPAITSISPKENPAAADVRKDGVSVFAKKS
jgi:hypothetical protein